MTESLPTLAVILGARDPEMNAIEALARQHGVVVLVAHDAATGNRLNAQQAAKAPPAKESAAPRCFGIRLATGDPRLDGITDADTGTTVLADDALSASVIVALERHDGGAALDAIAVIECPAARRIARVVVQDMDDRDECRLARLVVDIDHHNIGDAGWGREPADFFNASSLGQFVIFLLAHGREVEVTSEMRLIAAADHCLTAAYAGLCPGVDPVALRRHRVAEKAAFLKKDVAEIEAEIEDAVKTIASAPRMADALEIVDLRETYIPHAPEAAAITGQSLWTRGLPRPDSTVVENCFGAKEACQKFLDHHCLAGRKPYGDPMRGVVGCQV